MTTTTPSPAGPTPAAAPVAPAGAPAATPVAASPVAASAVPATPTPVVAALRAALPAVHLPGTPAYAALTGTFNLAAPVTPLAVVAAADAADVADVATTLHVAAAHGVPVAVQSTGHGPRGRLADAVLLSTRALDELTVDPATRTARVGAGVRWGAVVAAAAAHGLAPLCGSSPTVGVVGFLTGGGHGPLARSHGLSADTVRAFDVVTGDGTERRVTATEHPDLFWALRGGRGAAAVVTAVEIALFPVAEVHAGAAWFDGADAPAVLRTWATWCALLPEQATTSVALMRLPALPGVPPVLAGRTTLAVRWVWTGDPAEGEELFRAIRCVAPAIVDTVGVMPYAAIASVHADPDQPLPAHERHVLLGACDDATVDALLAVAGPDAPCVQAMVEVRQLGGRVRDDGGTPAAFAHRDAPYSVLVVGAMVPPVADLVPADAARVVDALAPWALPGALPSFASDDDGGWVARAYPEPARSRLRAVVAAYDPAHVLADGRLLDAA